MAKKKYDLPWAERCPERKKELAKIWWESNKERSRLLTRSAKLKRDFGITLEDYDNMFQNQDGCCAICGEHQDSFKIRLAVDHCHNTGKVRGLLCLSCNAGIGNLKDSPTLLKKALNYLEDPPNCS